MSLDVAIIGDRFMQPARLLSGLESGSGVEINATLIEQAWPDTPMILEADDNTDEAGLCEFIGSQADLGDRIAGATVLITHLAPVGSRLLDANPRLEFIGVTRGGVVNVDRAAVAERDIRLVNAPGRNATAVAEFTIAMMLSATRRMAAGHTALMDRNWRGDLYRAEETGPELADCTVGLIGFGRIGRLLPALLAPFGCRILVADPYVDATDDPRVEQVDIDTLLLAADIVSLHARVTPETRGLINAGALAAMKPGAYLINSARGPLVDYNALTEALVGGHLAGCALDTFAVEPLPADSPLLALDTVTVTPHIAGASTRTIDRSASMMADELRRYCHAMPPVNPVY